MNSLQQAASPSPTQTRAAAATATVAPTLVLPTAPPPTIPVVSPTQPLAPVSVTAKDNLRVRAAPSTSAAVVDRLNKGASAQAVGRTAASDWLQIILPTNPAGRGWISAEFVTATAPLDNLPVVQSQSPAVPTVASPVAVPPAVLPPPQPTLPSYYPPAVQPPPAPTAKPYYP
ncbi:MAG TPA: SH3 domain-containing protein [Anaerolineae bacterium]